MEWGKWAGGDWWGEPFKASLPLFPSSFQPQLIFGSKKAGCESGRVFSVVEPMTEAVL